MPADRVLQPDKPPPTDKPAASPRPFRRNARRDPECPVLPGRGVIGRPTEPWSPGGSCGTTGGVQGHRRAPYFGVGFALTSTVRGTLAPTQVFRAGPLSDVAVLRPGRSPAHERLPWVLDRLQRHDVPAEDQGRQPDGEDPDLAFPGGNGEDVVAPVHQPGRE